MELILPGVPRQRIGTDDFRVPVNAVLDQTHRLQAANPQTQADSWLCAYILFFLPNPTEASCLPPILQLSECKLSAS